MEGEQVVADMRNTAGWRSGLECAKALKPRAYSSCEILSSAHMTQQEARQWCRQARRWLRAWSPHDAVFTGVHEAAGPGCCGGCASGAPGASCACAGAGAGGRSTPHSRRAQGNARAASAGRRLRSQAALTPAAASRRAMCGYTCSSCARGRAQALREQKALPPRVFHTQTATLADRNICRDLRAPHQHGGSSVQHSCSSLKLQRSKQGVGRTTSSPTRGAWQARTLKASAAAPTAPESATAAWSPAAQREL